MRPIKARLARLEDARRLSTAKDGDDGAQALWTRLEALEARLIASGDDLQPKAKDSAAVNAVRAMMRGDMEAAARLVRNLADED